MLVFKMKNTTPSVQNYKVKKHVPSHSRPETDRGDAAEARPRMGGATADKYGLKQLVLFHSKTHILEFVCFCYAAHMLCYAASVAIIQDVRLCFLLRGPHALLRHKCCKHTRFSVSLHFGAGLVFFLLRGHSFSMKTISGVL